MRSALGITLALLSTLTVLGCGDVGGPTGVALGGNGTITITVSAGLTPTFTWTGGKAVELKVDQSTGGGVFWDIVSNTPTAGFSSPVVHGAVPATAHAVSASVPLAAGVDYTVHLTLVDSTTGSKVFRP